MNQNNNILSIALICLMLISCGGGGGGSGGGALLQPTYTQYVDFVNNGGTVPNVQGQIFRSRNLGDPDNFAVYTDVEFESLSSISLQYSVPDASGNQSISMTARVNWDGDPFSESDTFTGTLDSNDDYSLFQDDHLASVHTVQGNTDVYTIGFVDFGGLRTVEKTKYVTQLLQYRAYASSVPEYLSPRYDFLAFVMGDQTWASDMPSSGSATYNGFAQMLLSLEATNQLNMDEYERSKWYFNGTSTFTADFATRNISGQLVFTYDSYAISAASGLYLTLEEAIEQGQPYVIELENGTISGTSFSGTTGIVDYSETWDPGWGEYTTSFTGNFFGPDATELGGTFTYSENGGNNDSGLHLEINAVGTFTGCQGC